MGVSSLAVSHADTDALVAAAGAGSRLGLGPKLFVTVGGTSLLIHTIASVYSQASGVVAAVPPERVEEARIQLVDFPRVTVLPGGASRMESYRRAFQHTQAEYLVIRDVARPFASESLVAATIHAARTSGAAAACIDPDVPIARIDNGLLTGRLPRNEVVIPSNPQCYHRSVLEAVFTAFGEHELETLTFWEACILLDLPVSRVSGERRNIKITTRDDLLLAQYLFDSHVSKK